MECRLHWGKCNLNLVSHHLSQLACLKSNHCTPMIGEDQKLVTNEPVEIEDCRKITDHFRGIFRIYSNLIKENRRMWTCNQLEMQTIGSQPVMLKNLPNHCFTHETKSPWPLHFKHSHWGKRQRSRWSKFATSQYARWTNGVSMWMHYGCKVYMESYVASNGSCFLVTWTILKNDLSEVGLTQTGRPWYSQRSQLLIYFLLCHVWVGA